MPIAAAEQNRAVLAIANAGDDYLALATADPTAAGNNLIAVAGRVRDQPRPRERRPVGGDQEPLAGGLRADRPGRERHPLRHHVGGNTGGSVRAWGKLVDDTGSDATISQAIHR